MSGLTTPNGLAVTHGSNDALPAPSGDAAPTLLNFVAQAVADPSIDVLKLEALLRMQREIVAEDAKRQFAVALHAAQAEMPRVRKNGTIELGKDKDGKGKGIILFARWEDVDAAIRPIYSRHGFSLSFDTDQREGGGAVVAMTLEHTAGHSKLFRLSLPLDSGPGRNNLQALGSTLSYGKRYLAEMAFNIVREGADDDGKLGGTTFITSEQKDELVALMQDVRADTTGFLRYMDVRSLDEIERKDFAAARNALEAKRRKPGP